MDDNKSRRLDEEDAKYLEKVKKLEAKKDAKLKKKAERRIKRDKFLSKPLPTIVRSTLIAAFSVLVILVLYNLYGMYKVYISTNVWQKAENLAIADTPVDLLYSDDDDKALKEEYMKLSASVWNSQSNQFTPNVSKEKIDKLNEMYEKMNEPKKFAESTHSTINKLWPVKQGYDEIIIGNKVKASSLQQVESWISSHTSTVTKQLLVSDNQEFASEMYQTMIDLRQDLINLDELTQKLSKVYDVSGKTVTVRKNMRTTDIEGLEGYIRALNFEWPEIKRGVETVLDKSASHLKKNGEALHAYELYLIDVQAEATFKDMLSSREKALNDRTSMLIPYKNFVGKKLKDIEKWAESNQIELKVIERETNVKSSDSVISEQSPSPSDYQNTIAGATVEVEVLVYKEETIETEDSSTQSSREPEVIPLPDDDSDVPHSQPGRPDNTENLPEYR